MDPCENNNINKERYSEITPSYDENLVSDKNYKMEMQK